MVIIEMENGKQIKLELYPDKAPITVENFLKLVSAGFYDGLIFHRVIKDFMIQGGDPEGTGMGGAKEKIKGEFLMNGVPNDLRHERGVISMARAQNPNSASSQFFICHKDSFFLDGQFQPEYLDWVAGVESKEYYVNMMAAWYFATALAKQYDAVLPYIQQRRLEPWTHNKTIQKAMESERIPDGQKAYLRGLKVKLPK